MIPLFPMDFDDEINVEKNVNLEGQSQDRYQSPGCYGVSHQKKVKGEISERSHLIHN